MRLEQCIIQKKESPILFTGYVALNKLLGKSVFISNQQIGGADEVMMLNGVSHQLVSDDLEGAANILKWLEYVPAKRGEPFAVPDVPELEDPVDRDVVYYLESAKYDPRSLICQGQVAVHRGPVAAVAARPLHDGVRAQKPAVRLRTLHAERSRACW